MKNKLMGVVSGVCVLAGAAFAVQEKPAVAEQPAAAEKSAADEGLVKKVSDILDAGFSFDFFSAYVWRNAVVNDRMVMQPCVWAELTAFDPFTGGFSVWQNYDVTDRRRGMFKHAQIETDYNVHLGYAVWANQDNTMSFSAEVGHDWYTFQGVRRESKGLSPDTRELYVKGTFANPIVDVYGQVSWMYDDFGDFESGFNYEIGFNREVALCEFLTAGADWNINFADENYTRFLYGADTYGFGGTTIKVYLNWEITDWATLGGTIAYTGLLNGSSRDQLEHTAYNRDFVWGGFSLRLEF